MFTGIIESLGKVVDIQAEGTNVHFQIWSPISSELKVDQSVSHQGVCLTVVNVDKDMHWVTAVEETIRRTQLAEWKVGDLINLERCLKLGDRLDGHMVKAHVDTTGVCEAIEDRDGSWNVYVSYNADHPSFLTVPKGSICVNGVSLTVVESKPGYFSLTIIPYTWVNTQFHTLKEGDRVNIEFDILGKYITTLMENRS